MSNDVLNRIDRELLISQGALRDTDKKLQEKIETIEKELVKYKKLEEQLGCPLEVVFKAVLRWVYYDDTTGNTTRDFVDLHTNLDGEYMLLCNNAREIFLTRDYKRTWWLKRDKSE